jgi:hypothetical protein
MNVTSVNTISGTSYPSGNAPDLSAIVDDTTGKYTDAQKTLAFQQREVRDQAVIGPAFQKSIGNGDSTLPWRAALALLNSLSPAEQNSPRYAGTRQEIMLAISTNDGPSPWKSGPPGVEQIQWGVPSSTDTKAAAKESANWLKFIKGQIQSASTATPVGTRVSVVSADVHPVTSVSATNVSAANDTSVAVDASTQPETADVPLGNGVDTKA